MTKRVKSLRMNIPILLYHSVSKQSSKRFHPWTIHPDLFAEHMAYLSEGGYTPITVSQLARALRLQGNGLPNNPVVITFDDGFADFMSGALPILIRYGFPSTLYLVTGYVNHTSEWLCSEGEGNRFMLCWEEIQDLPLHGVECGAHSHSHRQLDIAPFKEACEEIRTSKEILEEKLGRAIETFSFPHGYHTNRLLRFLKQSDYSSSCIVGHAMANDRSDPYALPRIIINADVSTKQLGRFLRGKDLRRLQKGKRLQTLAWRFCRWSMDLMRQPTSAIMATFYPNGKGMK